MKHLSAPTGTGPVACIVSTLTPLPAELASAIARHGFAVAWRALGPSLPREVADLDPAIIVAVTDGADSRAVVLLRELTPRAPVVWLLKKYDERVAMAALESGVAVVLSAGSSSELVAAQVTAIARLRDGHRLPREPRKIVIGDLTIDLARRMVSSRGKRVELTRSEFDILALLAENAGRVVSPAEILAGIGQRSATAAQARGMVKVHVSHLRTKLDRVGGGGCVVTVRGVGYMVDSPDADLEPEPDCGPD